MMSEAHFWELIESAWGAVGGAREERQNLALGKLSEEKAESLQEAMEEILPALTEQLDLLSAEDLLAFDRVLERKLYDIDREDIQEYTDGSDDGFLYKRGYIVAAGADYYNAVLANPSAALIDLECEDMCYLSCHLYEDKFGVMPPSEISRESGSNKAGWPNRLSEIDVAV